MAGPTILDQAGTAGTGTNTTTCTVSSYAVSAGTNRALVAMIATGDATEADTVISSVAWDAAGVNEALTCPAGANHFGANGRSAICYLVNPTAKTADLTVTFAGTNSFVKCNALVLQNVDQTTVVGDADETSGTGTAVTLTLTTTAANSLLVDNLRWNDSSSTLTTDTLRQIRHDSPTTAARLLGSEWAVTDSGANFTMAWTGSNSREFTFVALEFLAAAQPGGLIAFDAESNNANDAGSTITLAHTVGAGTNRFLFACAVAVDATEADRTVSGIASDVDGALTLLAAYDVPNRRITCGYLIAPTTGAHVITVTLGGANSVLRAGGVSFSGVHQSDPLDGGTVYTAAGTATDATDDITTATDNAWALALLTHGNNINHFSGPGQTVLQSIWGTNVGRGFAVEQTPTAGVVTMNWTSASSIFQNFGVSIRSAAAAGAGGVRRRQVIS